MASFLLPSAIFFKSSSDDTSRADGLASLSKAGIFAAVAVDSGFSYGESFCFSRISSRSCCIIVWAISRHCWVFRIARGPALRLSDDTKETSGMGGVAKTGVSLEFVTVLVNKSERHRLPPAGIEPARTPFQILSVHDLLTRMCSECALSSQSGSFSCTDRMAQCLSYCPFAVTSVSHTRRR